MRERTARQRPFIAVAEVDYAVCKLGGEVGRLRPDGGWLRWLLPGDPTFTLITDKIPWWRIGNIGAWVTLHI